MFMVLCLSWQVCMEGEISRQSIMNSLSRGKKASGDLIPWTISEQVGDLAVQWHPGCVSCISCLQSAQLCPLMGSLSLVQFQDPDFGGLSGGRVVRIAVHPDYQGVKYLGPARVGPGKWLCRQSSEQGKHCSSSSP